MSVLTNLNEVRSRFPACVADGVDISATFVPVLADARRDDLGYGSATRVTQGMALWFALITHLLGVEAYVSIIKVLFRLLMIMQSSWVLTRPTTINETTLSNLKSLNPMLTSGHILWP